MLIKEQGYISVREYLTKRFLEYLGSKVLGPIRAIILLLKILIDLITRVLPLTLGWLFQGVTLGLAIGVTMGLALLSEDLRASMSSVYLLGKIVILNYLIIILSVILALLTLLLDPLGAVLSLVFFGLPGILYKKSEMIKVTDSVADSDPIILKLYYWISGTALQDLLVSTIVAINERIHYLGTILQLGAY